MDAFNRGLDLAAGEWVNGLADDDELPPRALELLRFFAEVFSFDAEPSGRSLYGVGSSAVFMRSSRAWTVSSVSISKPVAKAGNDLTKRRENTR